MRAAQSACRCVQAAYGKGSAVYRRRHKSLNTALSCQCIPSREVVAAASAFAPCICCSPALLPRHIPLRTRSPVPLWRAAAPAPLCARPPSPPWLLRRAPSPLALRTRPPLTLRLRWRAAAPATAQHRALCASPVPPRMRLPGCTVLPRAGASAAPAAHIIAAATPEATLRLPRLPLLGCARGPVAAVGALRSTT